jgi:hypothetical protein
MNRKVDSSLSCRARPMAPGLSHGGVVLAPGAGMFGADAFGAKLFVPAGACARFSCSTRVGAPEAPDVSAALTWASWLTDVCREGVAAL